MLPRLSSHVKCAVVALLVSIAEATIASTPAITFKEENTTELVKSLTSLQRLGTRTIDNSVDETLSTFSKKRMNVQKAA